MKVSYFFNTLSLTLAEKASKAAPEASTAAQSSAEAAKASGRGPLGLDVITYIYIAILAFFVYQLYKSHKYKKLLEEPVQVVHRKAKMINYILAFFLVILGFLNAFNAHNYLTGMIMGILGFVFGFQSGSPIYLAPNGLLADNAFITWSEIKRWGWNTENGDLVVEVKRRGKPSRTSAVHVGTDQMNKVNDYIRQLKLGKD